MSVTWVAAIIVAITIIPVVIFIQLHRRRERKKAKALLAKFHEAGAQHGLNFTHEHILKDKVIGLDERSQTLLLFEPGATQQHTLMRLAEIKTCTVYREYDAINLPGNKTQREEPLLSGMGLHVIFSTGAPSITVPLYNRHADGIYELEHLEAKAKEWQGLLSEQVRRKVLQQAYARPLMF